MTLEALKAIRNDLIFQLDIQIEALEKAQQLQAPKLERWKLIDFTKEPLSPREIARRKLEWLARELRALTPHKHNTDYYFIDCGDSDKWRMGYYTVNDLIRPRLGTFAFHSRKDADYALEQMTDEELEALR